MALDIIPASEEMPVEQTVIMIYGDPGAGKSSTGFTADTPLLLDFAGKGGAHRSAFRQDTVRVNSWEDVQDMNEADLAPYKTLVVDTVGGCLDLIALDIIANDPRMSTSSGGLTLQGYGALKNTFSDWLRKIKSFGLDIVFIAHGKERESDDVTVYRPDITGGSYDIVFAEADGVAHLHMRGKNRTLDWSPTGQSVGKNPAQIEREAVPHFAQVPDYLAQKIEEIKESIGRISEEGKQAAALLAGWSTEIEQAGNADDVNELVKRSQEIDSKATQKQVKAMVSRRAKDLNLTWSKEEGGYVEK